MISFFNSLKFIFALFTIVLVLSGATASYSSEPDKIINYRKVLMKATASHITAIASIVRSDTSYISHINVHANAIANIASIMPATFPEGTLEGNTRAKTEIWSDWQNFVLLAAELESAALMLAKTSDSGDKKTLSDGLNNIGKACGSCHELFRKPAR